MSQMQKGRKDQDDDKKPPPRSSNTERERRPQLGESASNPDAAMGSASGPISARSKNIIKSPNPDDILMGREWSCQVHPGNRKMRMLVEMHKETYNRLSLSGKGDLTKELLRIIRRSGSRFLKKIQREDKSGSSEEGWEIAPRAEAYEKVCHALRGKPKTKRQQELPLSPFPNHHLYFHPANNLNNSIADLRSLIGFQPAPWLDTARISHLTMPELTQQQRNPLPPPTNEAQQQSSGPSNFPIGLHLLADSVITTTTSPSDENGRRMFPTGRPPGEGETAVVSSSNPTQGSTSEPNSTTTSTDDSVEDLDDSVHPAIRMALARYLNKKG